MAQDLIMSETQWGNLSSKLEDPFFQRVHDNNERAVDLMIEQGSEDFWQLGGDLTQPRRGRENPWFWRIPKHRLYRFALSWRLTGREDSLAEALRAVEVLLNRSLWGTEPKFGLQHGDLRTADWWTSAVFALEALAPALSRAQNEGLLELLTEWALPAYLKGIEAGEWWRYANFNWGAAVHGAGGMAALAVRDAAPRLSEEALAAAKRGLGFVIDNLPAGGFWTEGLMYQTTTLTHLTEFVAALHRTDGDDLGLIGHPRLRESLDSRLWMLGGDDRPLNFSNIKEIGGEWRLPAAYWWARQCERPDWAGFEEAFPRAWENTEGVAFEIETFWWRETHQSTRVWAQPTGLWHGRELDWLSWKRGQAWLAFRGGFNGGNHNNLDLGQIIFGIGKERILGDPGYGVSATARHSCITIRDRDQAMDATAPILRAEEFALGDGWLLHVCCDLKAAYPHALDRHHRHLLAFSEGSLLLIDDILSAQGRRLAAKGHLQLRHQPEKEASGGAWTIPTSTGSLHIQSHGCVRLPSSVPAAPDAGGLVPLAYAEPADAPAVRFAISLSPGGAFTIDTPAPHQLRIQHAATEVTLDLGAGLIHPRPTSRPVKESSSNPS